MLSAALLTWMSYTQPLILLFSAVALISLLYLRCSRGAWLTRTSVAALLLLSWPPAAWLFSRPLEGRYPIRPFDTEQNYQAIVILSSSVSPPQFERPYALADEDTFHRCRFGAWLYHRRPLPVLLCGGRGTRSAQAYASDMRTLLVSEGVPEAAIWTEEQSRSTHENAVYGAAVLQQHGIRKIALVVDATSMPRAQRSFVKQGIEAVPAPSDFFEPSFPEALVPSWKGIRQNELTFHEALGLGWYWIRGWV